MALLLHMFAIVMLFRGVNNPEKSQTKTHMHNAAEMKILHSTKFFCGMLGKWVTGNLVKSDPHIYTQN